MKLSYDELAGKSRILQSLTGLKPDEFETLLESFAQAWKNFVRETLARRRRIR